MNFSIYSSSQEENIFIRQQAKTWLNSGLITADQLGTITGATDPDLRQTNLFFRILFFFFTYLCTGALVGLCVWLMSKAGSPDETLLSVILIFFSAIYYMAAEYMVGVRRFYRYGIEEALALIAVVLFIAGCGGFLSKHGFHGKEVTIVVAALAAITALLIHLRFGFLYAAIISMIAASVIPFQLALTPTGQRMLLLSFFCLILFFNITKDKHQGEDFRKERNTTIQAGLLIAIYLIANLHFLSVAGLFIGNNSGIQPYLKSFPPYIYWSSYVLIPLYLQNSTNPRPIG